MAEKTIRVYDGVKYKDITYEEILNADGNPTGRYKTIKEEPQTIYGTYLDIQENYNQLKTDIETLSKHKQSENGIYSNNYIGLLTDKKERIFLFSRLLRHSSNAVKVKTWFDWVISVLQTIGYVNDPYYKEEDSIGNIISIEFTITLKDGSDSFKMYLLPMDDNSYTLSQE